LKIISCKDIPAAKTYYFGYDGQGSVRYLTDSDGNVTDTYDYDAFGNLLSRTGTTDNNYLYTGEQWDFDLEMYFLRARYMDTDSGRFWGMDSWEGINPEPNSLHKYNYCYQNPFNNVDPSGMSPLAQMAMTVTISNILANVVLTGLFVGDMVQNAGVNRSKMIYVSLRADGLFGKYGLGGGGGVDVLFSPDLTKVWAAPVGEAVVMPVGVFKSQRASGKKLQVAGAFGVVFDVSRPEQMEGLAGTGAWPLPLIRLLPSSIFKGTLPGWLMMLARKPKWKDATVIFGVSPSGPVSVQAGIGKSFAFSAGWAFPYTQIYQRQNSPLDWWISKAERFAREAMSDAGGDI
jgi:RHS repeat-associated protein